MKTQNLFFMLILISMAFSFISCTDEDDKVEIPQLVGKWIVKEPVLQDDFVTCYTSVSYTHLTLPTILRV